MDERSKKYMNWKFDLSQWNEDILNSPGYRDRVALTMTMLRQQLFLTEEEIQSLNLEEKWKKIPTKLVVGLAVRCLSYDFKEKYSVDYNAKGINVRQIAGDVEDLEYSRMQREKMTPIQNEYIALWAEELEKLFGEVKERKRQFPPQAYQQQTTQRPTTEEKTGPSLQDRMSELFKDFNG